MAEPNYRSPNYPRHTLDTAIEKVRVIYEKQHKHPASKDVIAHALGYRNANTGTAKAIIASLRYYGLLDATAAGMVVSGDAMCVLQSAEEDPERIEAMLRIAFAPSILAEIRRKFGDELPLSIRHDLLAQGFSPRAADEIPRLYRANLEFLREETVHGQQLERQITSAVEHPGKEATDKIRDGAVKVSQTCPNDPREPLGLLIGEGMYTRVSFLGRRPTRTAIKKLIALLEMQADNFPAD